MNLLYQKHMFTYSLKSLTVSQILAPFDVARFRSRRLAVHHQFWAMQQLRRRMVAGDHSIVATVIRNRSLFHCDSAWHELLWKLLSQIEDGENETVVPVLETELDGGLLRVSFLQADQDEQDGQHCLCSTIRCLQRLRQLVPGGTDALVEILLPQYMQRTAGRRCSAHRFLSFCHELLAVESGWSDGHQLLADLFLRPNWRPPYAYHFGREADFAGTKGLDNDQTPDCALIRSHVLALLKSLRYRPEQDRFMLLFHCLRPIQLSADDTLLYVFINEDGQLFEMLHLVASLLPTTDHYLVHRLWHRFVMEIGHDTDTLLDMLIADGETAQHCLRFLLCYLKLAPFDGIPLPEDLDRQLMPDIRRTLRKLSLRIHSRYLDGNFPYNPQPLLRLLYRV